MFNSNLDFIFLARWTNY